MEQSVVRVQMREIERVARLIKKGGYHQVILGIKDDGTLDGGWFKVRADLTLEPAQMLLFDLTQQTEASIIYAITTLIHNKDGYEVVG